MKNLYAKVIQFKIEEFLSKFRAGRYADREELIKDFLRNPQSIYKKILFFPIYGGLARKISKDLKKETFSMFYRFENLLAEKLHPKLKNGKINILGWKIPYWFFNWRVENQFYKRFSPYLKSYKMLAKSLEKKNNLKNLKLIKKLILDMVASDDHYMVVHFYIYKLAKKRQELATILEKIERDVIKIKVNLSEDEEKNYAFVHKIYNNDYVKIDEKYSREELDRQAPLFIERISWDEQLAKYIPRLLAKEEAIVSAEAKPKTQVVTQSTTPEEMTKKNVQEIQKYLNAYPATKVLAAIYTKFISAKIPHQVAVKKVKEIVINVLQEDILSSEDKNDLKKSYQDGKWLKTDGDKDQKKSTEDPTEDKKATGEPNDETKPEPKPTKPEKTEKTEDTEEKTGSGEENDEPSNTGDQSTNTDNTAKSQKGFVVKAPAAKSQGRYEIKPPIAAADNRRYKISDQSADNDKKFPIGDNKDNTGNKDGTDDSNNEEKWRNFRNQLTSEVNRRLKQAREEEAEKIKKYIPKNIGRPDEDLINNLFRRLGQQSFEDNKRRLAEYWDEDETDDFFAKLMHLLIDLSEKLSVPDMKALINQLIERYKNEQ